MFTETEVCYILGNENLKKIGDQRFFIIITKCYFSFYNIFFYTQLVFVFTFCEIFLSFTTILSLFFSSLDRFRYRSRAFFYFILIILAYTLLDFFTYEQLYKKIYIYIYNIYNI